MLWVRIRTRIWVLMVVVENRLRGSGEIVDGELGIVGYWMSTVFCCAFSDALVLIGVKFCIIEFCLPLHRIVRVLTDFGPHLPRPLYPRLQALTITLAQDLSILLSSPKHHRHQENEQTAAIINSLRPYTVQHFYRFGNTAPTHN